MPRPSRPAARGRSVLGLDRLEDRTNPVTFAAGDAYSVGSFIEDLASDDLSGDGFPDIVAVSGSIGADILINDGTGKFSVSPTPVPSSDANSVNLADLNGDGALDVVTTDAGTDDLLVALGNNDGTFGTPLRFATGADAVYADVADFNGDGRPDVAVVAGGVRVFLNNGTQTLFSGSPTTYDPGAPATDVVAGDFDGDGDPDLALAGDNWAQVDVLLNNGDGTFAAPTQAAFPSRSRISLVAADVNEDGRDDLVASLYDPAEIGVLLATSTGSFTAPVAYPLLSVLGTSSYVESLVVADFDLDGNLDAAPSLTNGAPDVSFFAGDGAGGFAAPVALSGVGGYSGAQTSADVNLDGRPDIIAGTTLTPAVVTVALNTTAAPVVTVRATPSAVAGQGFDVTVTVRDAAGNPDPSYTGTVTFTSDDPLVSPGDGLPADYTFVAGDNGTKTFTGVFLETAGRRTVTATATGLPVPASTTVRVSPAAALAGFAVTGPTATTAGVSQTYTVNAVDAFGNLVPTVAPVVRVTSSDTRAVLPANFTLTNGTATFSVELRTAGTQSITVLAAANGAINGTLSGIVVSPAAAAAVAVVDGGGQSTLAGTDFATPLSARVVDAFGNGVQGVTVTFTAPGAGASATFPNGATPVSDAAGNVSVAARANATVGGYTVTAAAGGASSGQFVLGNTSAPAAGVVVVSGAGQTPEVGDPFTDPLVVRVVDTLGNPVEGAVVVFTGPTTGAGATFPASGVVVSDAGGLAQLTPTANATAGAYTVTATVTAGGATYTAGLGATNTAGPPAAFNLDSGGDQSVAVGTPFDQPVVIKVVDAQGNGVAGVTVTLAVGVGPGGASALVPDGLTADTDGDGLARFAVESNTVAGSYTLTATAAGLPGSVVVNLTNLPGTAVAVNRVSGNNQAGAVNASFANPLRVKVVDNFGNGVPGAVVVFAGPGSGAGALFPNGAEVTTDADGFAEAAVRANVVAGGPYTVTASTDGVANSAAFSLTNTNGPAALVRVLAGDGATGEVGADFAAPIEVKVEDAFGNGVPNVVVTFAAPGTGPSATFPAGTTATTGADGTASLAVRANTLAGSYTVTASAPGAVAAGSATLTNLAGAPVSLVSQTGNGQSATVNTAFGQRLGITVIDRFGNGVPGAVVRFAGPLDPATAGVAFLSGPATEITTDAAGRAEAAPGANIVAGSYGVTATVAGVAVPVVYALTNTPGAAFAVQTAAGAGQSAEVEGDYAAPLTALVTDRFGNPVPGVLVTFTAPATGATVTFPNGNTATTGADGRAAVAVRATETSGPFAVTAAAAGLDRPVNFPLTNTAGAAVGVAAVSGGGQTARVNTAFLDPLVVAAVDRLGNPVPGVTVELASLTGGFAEALFPGGTTATTGIDGLARFPAVANTGAGVYTVAFRAAGLPGLAEFTLTNAAGTPTTVALLGGNGLTAAAGNLLAAPLSVLVTDQFGNAVAGVDVVFSAPSFGPTATFPTGATVTTGANGAAAISAVAGPAVGSYTVTAAVPGTGQVTFALTTVPDAPAVVAIVGGDGQVAQTNSPYAQPLVVEVRDRFGNPIPGVAVSAPIPLSILLVPPPPTASVVPGSVTTGADGRASFTATANGVAGAHTLSFAVPGAQAATFGLTNVAPPTGLVGSDTTAVGAGPGQPPVVRVLNPDGSERAAYTPFPGFTGGVRTAVGDFNADGTPDVASGTGPGAALVVVTDGATGQELFRALPFGDEFRGGVFVAAGDLDGDGAAELVVTPDVGGGPRVVVHRGRDFTQVASFFGIDDPAFRGGARAALGDFNGDRKADLVVAAGTGGGPRVVAYDGVSVMAGGPAKLFNDIFVFDARVRDGVYVAAGDVDGDGRAELIAGGGPGGGPRVLVLSGADLLAGSGPPRFVANFFAGPLEDRNGVRVSVKDLDADDRADLMVGAVDKVRAYYGATITSTGTPPEAFSLDATLGVFVG